MLNDKKIRQSLISRLNQQSIRPKVILEELRVHNGNAIADVVTVHSFAHCYEIKGETDSIYRITRQSQFYDLAFKKVTLVTTEKQLETALKVAPPHWGIMCAKDKKESVVIAHIRKAIPSPIYDKKIALLTLWKSELVELAEIVPIQKAEKLNRLQLSEALSIALSEKSISESIGDKLLSRRFK